MTENIREIALDTILAWEKEKVFSHKLIKAVLDKYDYLESRDKAFIKRVTEGTIERQIELDYCIEQYSSVPVRKMKPFIRCLIRMSVYQLLYMENVPDSAVCNEAVKLAVKRKFSNLRGFVNGLLRNIARNKEQLCFPKKEDGLLYLSIQYSMPMWIVELWARYYGEVLTEQILEGMLAIHPVCIRFRRSLTQKQISQCMEALIQTGAKLEQSPYNRYVYHATHLNSPAGLPGFAEGMWTIQDVSSVLAVELADIKKTDFVLDVCAAPGGKSMLAAELAERVLARDVAMDKIPLMEDNCQRMGLDNLSIQCFDATVYDPKLEGKADVVLLDVPCSGLGVMGKKRDIKYRVTPEGLEELHRLQKQIAEVCVRYVKPGGTLLYSTCTIHPEENENMVTWLCEELKLLPVDLTERLPLQMRQQRDLVRQQRTTDTGLKPEQQNACLQMLPGIMETDGFFVACLQKPLS